MELRKRRALTIAVFLYLLVWVGAVAVAATDPKVIIPTPLSEHADQIMSAQMYIILVLVGLVQGLISFIFLSSVNDLKKSVRKLFDEMEHKQGKDDCDRLREKNGKDC